MNETKTDALNVKNSVDATLSQDACPPIVPISQPDSAVLSSQPDSIAPTISHLAKKVQWYVMRSSYCRELKAKDLLEKDGFTCFVPMQKVRTEHAAIIKTQMVPVVHNLIFVRTSRLKMDPWKRLHEANAALRYMMDKSTKHPMVVSDKSMQDFMQVTSQSNDDILYLDNPEVVVERGQKVEIIVGPFKGVQGYVLRIRRDRRVVVSLEGLVAVAMASMPQSHFRLLSQSRGLTP